MTKHENIDRVRKHMVKTLGCRTLCWEMPGPKDTSVATIQCWAMNRKGGGVRLVIVEIYESHGFDIFPQICSQAYETDPVAIEALESVNC